MKSTLLKLALFSTMAIGLVSCDKDKDDASANQVTDATGVQVKLNWSMTDGSSAIDGADIDYYIYKGVGGSKEAIPTISATNSASFEDASFLSSLPDGDYTVVIDYFEVLKNGKFNLLIQAMGGTANVAINDNNFTTANNGQEVDFAKLNKSGTKFTLTKL